MSDPRAAISRRHFLQALAALSAAAALPRVAAGAGRAPINLPYDDGSRAIPGGLAGVPERVIVIGAGFAGLAVANAMGGAGVPCVVLEGRDRIGGRARTVDVGDAPVDLGCSWITDPVGNPMTQFATQSGVLQTNASIELDVPTSRFYDERTGVVLPSDTIQAAAHALRFEQYDASNISSALGPKASMKDGIEYYLRARKLSGNPRRFAEFFLRLICELPDATDWNIDSLKAFADYSSPYVGFGEGDFPRGGYTRLVASLAGGADIRLRHHVTHVIVGKTGVQVIARDGSGTQAEFGGSHVVVTVPLGILKAGAISFAPKLPAAKAWAIRRLGFGTFEKTVMRFPEPYWLGEHTHIFHRSERAPMQFPLIVDYFYLQQKPILVAFNTGSRALALDTLSDHDISARMTSVLRKVQGGPIPDPTHVVITRWGRDRFSRGSYSFVPVGARSGDQDLLAAPVGGRLLFAGEATSATRYGFADGAFSTGIRESKRLLQAASVRLHASTLT
jgi:monoamine oxidase